MIINFSKFYFNQLKNRQLHPSVNFSEFKSQKITGQLDMPKIIVG